MKVWQLIITLISATFLIENVYSVDERGQEPKLYKSFDELFGKGWDDESNDSKDLNCRHVKEEVQDGQAPITSDQKNIEAEILKQKFDEIYAENWSEDENNSAPDQNENVDEQQNESNKCEKIESDQQKREIIQKFRQMKEDYKKKIKYSKSQWTQIEIKISNGLGVSRTTIYRWIKELGLKKETKFSDLEKGQILKQFEKIKSKCKKAKLKNSQHELDEKIARKLGVCAKTIYEWKSKFGFSVSNKISDATKIGILKKYAKIKGKNPKIRDCDIANLLKISSSSLYKWKTQFSKEIKNI